IVRHFFQGEVAEWSKAHAWNACRRATVSRVRIPPSPPLLAIISANTLNFARTLGCTHKQTHNHEIEATTSQLAVVTLKPPICPRTWGTTASRVHAQNPKPLSLSHWERRGSWIGVGYLRCQDFT